MKTPEFTTNEEVFDWLGAIAKHGILKTQDADNARRFARAMRIAKAWDEWKADKNSYIENLPPALRKAEKDHE